MFRIPDFLLQFYTIAFISEKHADFRGWGAMELHFHGAVFVSFVIWVWVVIFMLFVIIALEYEKLLKKQIFHIFAFALLLI